MEIDQTLQSGISLCEVTTIDFEVATFKMDLSYPHTFCKTQSMSSGLTFASSRALKCEQELNQHFF